MAERACPTCWAPLPRHAKQCPVCHRPVGIAAVGPSPAQATVGPDGGGMGTATLQPAIRLWPPTRAGLFVASAVAVGVVLAITLLLTIGTHLGPPAEAGTFASNTGIVYPIRRSPDRAVHALDTFVPAGDAEDVQRAILNSTGNVGNVGQAAQYPPGTHIHTTIGGSGDATVVVYIPVAVARLVRKGWAVTGAEPEASILAKGQVTVDAPDDNEYIVRYTPRTRIAEFAFRLSAGDTTISPDNLNAMQVTSQTRSLG